ncbi:hypothetical protein GC176_22305 [bacterium]|nr:hypothetical protein [bacterium]
MLKLATKFIPVRHAFETAWRTGFRYAEFWLDGTLLDDWESIAQTALDFPLDYALHFPNRSNLNDEQLANCVRLYETLQCQAMVIHAPMRERYGGVLLGLKPDIVLAVENHKLTPAAFDEWADSNTYLTLDVEHVWKFTLEDGPFDGLIDTVQTFVNRHGDKLRHVHMPGYVPGFGEHRPMYCSRDKVFAVLSMLQKVDYRGLVVSEINAEYQNELDLRMDRLLFDRWRETVAQTTAE